MLSANRDNSSGQAIIRQGKRQTDGIVIDGCDDHSSFFHSTWLRDCGYYAKCGDSCPGRRFVVPVDIRLDATADKAGITAEGLLCSRDFAGLASLNAVSNPRPRKDDRMHARHLPGPGDYPIESMLGAPVAVCD